VIEVQTGGYLGEDDIVRFDDTYGRCAAIRTRDETEAVPLPAAAAVVVVDGADAVSVAPRPTAGRPIAIT
jgi:mannose-1-phosphate guanylyltransferase/mannose-6-phosphate isomerase